MSAELRLSRLASQLYGDLAAVDEIVRDDRHASEQQKIQLILDAFEQVGVVALDEQAETRDRTAPGSTVLPVRT